MLLQECCGLSLPIGKKDRQKDRERRRWNGKIDSIEREGDRERDR